MPVPTDLGKLSDVIKNDIVKKTFYDELVTKVNSIDTSEFVLKNQYDTEKTELENKISDTTGLVKKAGDNSKITELKNKILDLNSLATKTALTTVENKIPNISSLVKKTDYKTKITEIEKKLTDQNYDKYITTPELNTLAAGIFYARLAQGNLVTKTNFDVKLFSLNRKITSNENELQNLKTFDSSYFRGKSHFEEDGTQNYLVFQPINRYFKVTDNKKYISSWKPKGLSDETIKPLATFDNGLSPLIDYLVIK